MEDCKAPNCVYNEKRNKCVKPNPYVQWLSKCKKTLNSIQKCKNLYTNSIEKHKKKACDYYKENINVKPSTCPKNRLPTKNNKCPENYPIKKLNKNNDECCYKKKKEVNKIKGIKIDKKISEIKSNNNKLILPELKPVNLINGKLPKLIYKYQNKPKINKIPKLI
jgi:hypothetical protein